MGLLRILRAKASMALGKVAENMTVWRSGRTLSTMRITCGHNTACYSPLLPPSSARSRLLRALLAALERFQGQQAATAQQKPCSSGGETKELS